MDVIMDCFFANFETTERNSLHAKYKRRAIVEYISTLIEGCRISQNLHINNESNSNVDAEPVVRDAIVAILRYHDLSRRNNSGVCLMGKYHNILYVALKLCYDWQLRDTPTIVTLLDEIYACERTFERLFVGALFGINAPHFISGWKSDFANQEENFRAMVYYMDHSINGNCCYGVDNVRFIDVPIESCGRMTPLKIAIQLCLPHKVHIFLRFGASVLNDTDSSASDNVISVILNKLNDFDHCYPYNMVSCLQLLMRAVPFIKGINLNHVDVDEANEDVTKAKQNVPVQKNIKEVYEKLIGDCILPIDRCGFTPPALKHLCRCVIRESLNENYQLPCGIRQLPIPESAMRYLDLFED